MPNSFAHQSHLEYPIAVSAAHSLKTWQAKLKGAFMLFRILAVCVWAFSVGMVSNAAAVADGFSVNFAVFAFVLFTAALVQGYPAHIVNEIYDWKSGADRNVNLDLPARHDLSEQNPEPHREKKKTGGAKIFSGGSKVIAAGLMTVDDLWRLFYLTTGVVAALALFVALFRSWQLLLFLVPGFLFCIFYSLPPFRFAYRPFLGEFLGGFAGIVLLVTGGYFAQSGMLPLTTIILALSMGFMYAAIMVFFHYLDYETDRLADPPKRTTVVFLGLEGSRIYALVCAGVGTLMMLYLSLTHHLQYLILVMQGLMILYCHWRVKPFDANSIVYWGKILTYFILIAGLIFATLIEPRFAFMLPVYLLSFLAHKRFGKLRLKTQVVATS
jgi:1,4-dihydroxy-2-naphthoate octaprenyltransferase